MSERRYSDAETNAIFRLAAAQEPESRAPVLSHTDGHSLADLQAIGGEVGISAEAVSRAAKLLEVQNSGITRTLLRLPIGVERRVQLGRRLTDDEWEQIVVQLREVFQARGRMKAEGSLRQWTNGNLYAMLEPTPTGHRIRLGSMHGGAVASIRMGLAGIFGAGVLSLASLFGLDVSNTVPTFLAAGVALLTTGALRVPGWARLRARQMENIAAQLALPPGSSPPEPGAS